MKTSLKSLQDTLAAGNDLNTFKLRKIVLMTILKNTDNFEHIQATKDDTNLVAWTAHIQNVLVRTQTLYYDFCRRLLVKKCLNDGNDP